MAPSSPDDATAGRGQPAPAADRAAVQLIARISALPAPPVPSALTEDAEALHQFRIALREARTLLALPGWGPPGRTLRAELGWLADAVTPLRDLDVFTARLRRWSEEAPADLRAGLGGCLDQVERLRTQALAAAGKAFGSHRYRALVEQAGGLTVVPTGSSPGGDGAYEALLRRRWDRLRRAARALRADATPDELHRLRIRNKQVRGLLAATAAPGRPPAGAVNRLLDRLHDTLGSHQDAVVAAGILGQLEPTGLAAAAARWLRQRIQRRRRRAQRRATALAERITRAGNHWLPDAIRATLGGEPMLDLYIVRHAVAFERDPLQWPDDTLRPLTPKGRRRWRRAAAGLGRLVDPVACVLSSPWLRAWDTALILSRAAGWPEPVACEPLAGGTPDAVVEAIIAAGSGGPVALVGHEPYLHQLISHLLTADALRVNLELGKGSCARLTVPPGLNAGAGVLHWVLPARTLRALRR